ncbi:MAG: hypothetical protein SGI86_14460 [Deltaproteobacteria bacterium]|nr:hypothetical protein [Deltaproteobacteria bacterium]
MNRRSAMCRLLATGAVVLAGGSLGPQPKLRAADKPDAAPTFVRKAEKGFIDDPMAIDSKGKWLAAIRTDSASFADLAHIDLETGKTTSSFSLGSGQQIFERVVFTGVGRSIVLVSRDPATGKRSAVRFDETGKVTGSVGPADQIGFPQRNEKQYAVLYSRSVDKKKRPTTVLAVHDLQDLKAVGKPRTFVEEQGLVSLSGQTQPIKVLGFQDEYAQLVAQQPGGYDKASDVRVPDKAGIYDLLRSQWIWNGEIKDVLAWAYANKFRSTQPSKACFLDIPETQDSLYLIDGLGGRAGVDMREEFEMYDLRSLASQEVSAAGTLFFSMAVDPMNPGALQRKKADQPKLDLYRIDIPGPGDLFSGGRRPATHLLRAKLDNRPVGWVAGPGVAVILRKFKAYSRGGDAIEIYRL